METKTNNLEVNSTTSSENEFPSYKCGQQVVAKYKNNSYLVTIIHVNSALKRCIVEFKNYTLRLINFEDLITIKLPDKAPRCIVCKYVPKNSSRKVIVCYKCGKGYHMNCHTPNIPLECYYEGQMWNCNECVDNNELRKPRRKYKKRKLAKESWEKIHDSKNPNTERQRNKRSKRNTLLKLPYHLDLLRWDKSHTTNLENIYCYCCQNRVPYQMLQCNRCKQWFHGTCIQSLKFPLLKGDRFYVFVCLICNYGNEFLYRLKLTWLDLVQLVLFNILMINTQSFFDIDKIILFFADCNWDILQLPPEIYNISKEERAKKFLSVLINNPQIFRNGPEEDKGPHLWGLRLPQPPFPPSITVSETGILTEEIVKNQLHRNVVVEVINEENDVEVNIEDLENENFINYDIVDDIKVEEEVMQTTSLISDTVLYLKNTDMKNNTEKLLSEINHETMSENTSLDVMQTSTISNTCLFLSNNADNLQKKTPTISLTISDSDMKNLLINDNKKVLNETNNKTMSVKKIIPPNLEENTSFEDIQTPQVSSMIDNTEKVLNETNNEIMTRKSDSPRNLEENTSEVTQVPTTSSISVFLSNNDIKNTAMVINNSEKVLNEAISTKSNNSAANLEEIQTPQTSSVINNTEIVLNKTDNESKLAEDNNLANIQYIHMPTTSSISDVPVFLRNSDMTNIPIVNNLDPLNGNNNETLSNKNDNLSTIPYRIEIPSNALAPNMFVTIAIPYTVAVLKSDTDKVTEKDDKIVSKRKSKQRKKKQLSSPQKLPHLNKSRYTRILSKGESPMRLIKIT